MQEPSAEILHAFLLTPAQFEVLGDLIAHPDGLKREALQHGVSDSQVEELLHRNLIIRTGEHCHATAIGKGMMKALSGFSEA
jgi:hypothetical protein